MGQFLQAVLGSQGFEPHGYCFLWTRPLLWLYIVSDSLITLSYYSIPIALIYFVRKRRDLAFNWVFLFFAAFIIACGTTHLMALWTIWSPLYWLDAAVKAVTATTSVVTAVALWPLIPKALALPSPAQLEVANLALQEEVRERNRAKEALRTAYDEMERRVRERTRELARTTETLEAEIAERRQGEERLRLQGAALESAANAIVITDREGCITWVNPAFATLTGYTSEEVLGRNPSLLKSGKHDEAFYRHLWETILAGRVWDGVIINRRKDGSLYAEEQTITPVRDKRGDITHFIAIKQDISERKRAEEALREIHDTLEAVIHGSPMGITILDGDGNVKLWNPAAERIFGWRQEEVLGRPLPSIPPDKSEEHRSFRERVLKGEAYSDVEIARQKKDGSLIDISLSTAPLRDAKGHIWGAMGIMADITEWKRAEEEIRNLAKFPAENPHPVLRLDREGVILYANEASQTLLREWGCQVGRPAHNMWGDLAKEALTCRERKGIDVECGDRIYAFVLAPIPDAGYVNLYGRDVTEQKRAEEALRLSALQLKATVEGRTRELQAANVRLEGASRHKSEFLANMSHELRTPLNSILGFSQLLRDPTFGALSEKQARHVANIEMSGQHLLALVEDLLDLSKVEAGKLELRPESVNLADALEAALATIRPQAEAKGLTLHLNFESVLPPLTADPVRLKQILYNLLSNAVKFTPTAGRISVAARLVHSSRSTVERGEQADRELSIVNREQRGEFVEIAMADTGIGIKAEDLSCLFQEFVQLEAAATKRYEGAGLGLALTRRLVELHGGTIWAESAGEGHGSTFTVRLPLGSPAETRRGEDAHAEPGPTPPPGPGG